MTEQILSEIGDGVLTIRINRPEKKNALTLAMYEAITAALKAGQSDPAVRCVLITGVENAFTSGNDIMDFIQAPPVDESSPVMQFLQTIPVFEKPIVAAVNGVAIGIGTTLLLHCDLVYAGEGARFQLPFVNLGLVPEAGSSYILPQMVGYQRAAELILLGEAFGAQKAYEVGIVNQVVPDEETFSLAREKAMALAQKAPAALRLSRSLLRQGSARAVQETIVRESSHFASRLQSPEAAEAFQAFMERRKPDFSQFE